MEIRRYGKTTGMALEAIGKAMQSPGKTIELRDETIHAAKVLCSRVEDAIRDLNLRDIDVTIEMDTVMVVSVNCGYIIDAGDAYKVTLEKEG